MAAGAPPAIDERGAREVLHFLATLATLATRRDAGGPDAEPPEKARIFGSYHLWHFVGTFLANRAGTNLAAASYVLGHKDLATTSIYVHADEDGARELLDRTEGEMRKAASQATRWAKKRAADIAQNAERAENSDPIRIRSSLPTSQTDCKTVGARGFEPPTPRPPV